MRLLEIMAVLDDVLQQVGCLAWLQLGEDREATRDAECSRSHLVVLLPWRLNQLPEEASDLREEKLERGGVM